MKYQQIIYTHICMYIHVYVCIYVYTYIYMCVHKYLYIFICVCQRKYSGMKDLCDIADFRDSYCIVIPQHHQRKLIYSANTATLSTYMYKPDFLEFSPIP